MIIESQCPECLYSTTDEEPLPGDPHETMPTDRCPRCGYEGYYTWTYDSSPQDEYPCQRCATMPRPVGFESGKPAPRGMLYHLSTACSTCRAGLIEICKIKLSCMICFKNSQDFKHGLSDDPGECPSCDAKIGAVTERMLWTRWPETAE